MSRLVVDASVLVKLFFEEEYSDAAERWVGRAEELLAPDLIWAEAANVVWKRVRRGEIDGPAAVDITSRLLGFPIRTRHGVELVTDAVGLALRHDQTVYDCLYVALAIRDSAMLVTGDRPLMDAFADTPIANYIRWVGDTPS